MVPPLTLAVKVTTSPTPGDVGLNVKSTVRPMAVIATVWLAVVVCWLVSVTVKVTVNSPAVE